MPVISTHSFVNHKGGVGKTTMTYQLSAAYAKAHPETRVLVIDTTEVGDVSELLMGGVYSKTARDTLRSLVLISNVTKLFLHALSTAFRNSHRLSHKTEQHSDESVVADVISHMPGRKGDLSSHSDDELKDRQMSINLEEYAIPLSRVNKNLPENMYLCPSGLEIERSIAFSDSQCHDIVDVLLESFYSADSNWKIFVDTDAATGGRPNVYTLIALAISDLLCLPLHADITDWYRVRPTLDDLYQLRTQNRSHARVHLVLWNGLSVQFKHEYLMGDSVYSTFTPTKAEQDILICLNKLVFQEAQLFPDIFAYYSESENSESFGKKSTKCIRNFSTVGVASKDKGVPIAFLGGGSVHGMHTGFNLSESTISHCRQNLEELVRAVEDSNKFVDHHQRLQDEKEITSRGSVKKNGKKKRKVSSPVSKARLDPAVRYKSYQLRNKYALRNRCMNNAASYSYMEVMVETSGTSSI